MNPLAPQSDENIAASITSVSTVSGPQLEAERPGASAVGATALSLSTHALTGGSNQFPFNVEQVPYNKSDYSVLQLEGVYNTQGQHVQLNNTVHCYAVGDCLAGSQFIYSSGGYRDEGDEGTHPFDLSVSEDARVFEGTCASGCSTGSTTMMVTPTASAGTQGDGRFLMDVNPSKVLSTGSLVAGSMGIFGTAGFSGTSFPVSVFLLTNQAALSQPGNLAPGTVTLAIATSGTPGGFATSTAALPASSGIACVADISATPNFETAAYTVVDGSHIQFTLNKVHGSGSLVAVGGLCGYGLEQKVDTTNGIRQVFPVLGSINATELYYADAGMPILGAHSVGNTSGYLNVSLTAASITRTGNVVTVTTAGNLPYDVNGLTLTVSGVADSSYNGSYVVSTTGPNTLTYANSGANSTSSGGTLTFLTGNYALYPMAEVLSVLDSANQQVDGAFTLAANNVPWAAGDAVEESQYYKQTVNADIEQITQYVPRPIQQANAGKIYEGLVGPGVRGWVVENAMPLTGYLGGGGTHSLPDDAYGVLGAWSNDFEVDAGANAIIRAHCNLNTCGRWDSNYRLFDLDGALSEDVLMYYPQSSTAQWQLHGVPYTFSPSGFSAGTINVGTLNATTINGALFGPSGPGHAQGLVPDPGATAGATRYLRDDGSWATPAGGGGTGGAGTMAAQNANAVAITGGNIDNAVIGGTTPAAGHFTTLSATSLNGLTSSGTAATVTNYTSTRNTMGTAYQNTSGFNALEMVSIEVPAYGYSICYCNAGATSSGLTIPVVPTVHEGNNVGNVSDFNYTFVLPSNWWVACSLTAGSTVTIAGWTESTLP